MQSRVVAGDAFDAEKYGMLTDRLGRALQRLGLRRVPKDVTPTLDDIVRRHRDAEAAERAEAAKATTPAPDTSSRTREAPAPRYEAAEGNREPRMRAPKSSSKFRSWANPEFVRPGTPCQPRIRWDIYIPDHDPSIREKEFTRRGQST